MKKFLLITLLLLLVGLVVAHFIAANKAEKQIDRVIQTQADASAADLSVQYSSIDVSPFSGNIDLSDVTITEQANVERASHLNVDMRYLDFLYLIFNGPEEGLKKISAADIYLDNISYLNRESLQEFSLASATLHYKGNLWDGFRLLYTQQPATHNHLLDIAGTGLSYSKPNTTIGSFQSDSAFAHFSFPKPASSAADSSSSFNFKGITWDPPASVQNNYGFFIQGFGYPLDALPISAMQFSFTPAQSSVRISKGSLRTELFTAQFEGTVLKDSTWAAARMAPLNIAIVDMSEDFKNVLANVETLLGITLPQSQNQISFQLVGPLSNPRITRNN